METETPRVTGRYQTSVREYLSHAPALNRGTRFSIAFGAMALILAVISLPDPVPVAIELGLAIALLSGYYSVPFTWLTLRSKREQVEEPVDVVADDVGLHFHHSLAVIDAPWEGITRIRETDDYFYLMAPYPQAYIFPKRAFDPAQLEAFRLLATSKGKLERR